MRAPLSPNKHVHAEQYVANFFRSNGWSVEMQQEDSLSADLLIRHGKHRFIVEIKALSEGRPDRVLPVLSMAILQAKAAAELSGNALPLAIIFVPEASRALAKRVALFAERFAKDVPVGIISERGEKYFSDERLKALSEEESKN